MLKPHMESEAYHFHFEFGLEILLPLRWHRQSPYNEFHRLQSAFIRKTPKKNVKTSDTIIFFVEDFVRIRNP